MSNCGFAVVLQGMFVFLPDKTTDQPAENVFGYCWFEEKCFKSSFHLRVLLPKKQQKVVCYWLTDHRFKNMLLHFESFSINIELWAEVKFLCFQSEQKWIFSTKNTAENTHSHHTSHLHIMPTLQQWVLCYQRRLDSNSKSKEFSGSTKQVQHI